MKASEMTDEQINEMATLAFSFHVFPSGIVPQTPYNFCGNHKILGHLVTWIWQRWDSKKKVAFKNFLLPNCTTQVEYVFGTMFSTSREIVVAALKADGKLETE